MKTTAPDFVADVPPGWEDRTMTTLIGPQDSSGFAANVVVIRDRISLGSDLEDYVRTQRLAMSESVTGLEVLDERPMVLGGKRAYRTLQRFSAQGRHLQQLQIFVLSGAVVFVITCTATAGSYNEHARAFQRITDSFRSVTSLGAAN